MSVNNLDYEDDKFDPMESVKADSTEKEKSEADKKKSRINKVNSFITNVTNEAKDKAQEIAEIALEKKLKVENARQAVNELVDSLTATALGGLCGLIGLPNDFMETLLKKELQIEEFNERCNEEISYNNSHIEQYKYDIEELNVSITDYEKKEERNRKVDQLADSSIPKIPKHLRDYPYYLDENVYNKWKDDKKKYEDVVAQLEKDNIELDKKRISWNTELVEKGKETAIGRKIKDSINNLKTSGTQIIKGVQLLIQNIITLFTEGIGAAVVAMGSGVVVSPSPNSIISSKQKIAASAQALGTAITSMLVSASELGLDGSLENEGFPNVVSALMPFATSLGVVAALA